MQKDRKILISKTISDAIDILIDKAFKQFDTNPQISKRYLEMVWNLSKAYKIRLGQKRKLFCVKCFTPWIPGKTVSIENDKNSGLLIYKCQCGWVRKIPPTNDNNEKELKP